MNTLYAFLGGFGARVVGSFGNNISELGNLPTPPKVITLDTTATPDTKVRVEKTVLGTANGAARNPHAAEAIARTAMEPHLQGYDLVVLIAALGGGTGAGFTRYAVDYCAQNGVPVIVIGLANAGDLTSVQNVDDTIRSIRNTGVKHGTTIPVHYVPDDGSNNQQNLTNVYQIVLHMFDVLQNNLTGFDAADMRKWATSNAAYAGISELIVTCDPLEAEGTKCCVVVHDIDAETPSINNAALRFVGRRQPIEGLNGAPVNGAPIIYAHMPPVRIGQHLVSQREYLKGSRQEQADPLADLFN